ncbi:B-cell receptor CD22 [Xenopus laevis]|uniref:B-cell receptor CD22 n=2 Tax=Xenopus laevis TaxID=8355 RepID=A0A1L8FP49_XENLA|nr:B-cell receptor CD22 [Xenopus laevis]OCT73359.1 hypothetical protein XELAEV_18036341mg [Xenopus laevis]
MRLQIMELHISTKGIFLLAALQGWFPGSECQDYYAYLPQYMKALKGSCVEIPCTFNMETTDFQLVWYRDEIGFDPEIFNNKNPSKINEAFRDRTFLVGNKSNSCSLRIDDVRHSETYYPCINGNINCDQYKGYKKVLVHISDTPDKPVLKLPTNLTEDKPARITCSVQHTCTHNPPVLEWNKVGFNKTDWREELEEGVWRFVHEMVYIPTYQDHGSPIICKANYRTGQVSEETVTLDITFYAKVGGSQNIREGNVLELECLFLLTNLSSTQYSWYKNGIPLNNKTQRTLSIYDVKESHSGNYSCKVHKQDGNFSSLSLTVTVTPPYAREELPMILGGIAGVILIMLIGLVLYIFARSRKLQKTTSGKRSVESVVQEHINPVYGNIEPESNYCNFTVNEDNPRNDTERIYFSQIERQDVYAQPNKKRGTVQYTSIKHVPRTQAAEEMKHEEIQYASIQH